MTIVAEIIAIIQSLAPLEPAAVAAIEAILNDATKVPAFDLAAATALIAQYQSATNATEAADDQALKAKFEAP